jgi:hypothetical protein
MQSFLDRLATRIVALGGTLPDQPAIFVDHKNIQSGAAWEQALGDALSNCESFVFMISPAFMASPWCGKEVGVAHFRYSSANRHPQGRYLFPMKWEASPLQAMGGGSVIPAPLDQFQHRPTGLSPSTAAAYEKLGLSPMIAQSKHRDKVTELIDQWAREIVTGTGMGPLPPLQRPITSLDGVHAPSGWTGAGARLPFDVCHHIYIASGTTFANGGGDLQVRRAMQGAFELMKARATTIDNRVKGLKGRVSQAITAAQIILVIADAAVDLPDRVIKAINSSPTRPLLGFLLLDTESGNTTNPIPEQWLTAKGLSKGWFSESFVNGHLKVTTPSTLAGDIETLLQKIRGEAMEAGSATAAQDASVISSAEINGIRIVNRPVVAGPTGKP